MLQVLFIAVAIFIKQGQQVRYYQSRIYQPTRQQQTNRSKRLRPLIQYHPIYWINKLIISLEIQLFGIRLFENMWQLDITKNPINKGQMSTNLLLVE